MERSNAERSDALPTYARPPSDALATNAVLHKRATGAGALLIALYLLPGLIGHQPWKQDEAYIADIARTMLDSGDFITPMMGGAPFMEKPPLYYWIAALCGQLFAGVLPFHDAARLANPLLLASTCWLVSRTGRLWWGANGAELAPILLLACLGMALHSHLLLTDLAMLPGVALATHGFALAPRRSALGGALIGTGAGIGFLAKGLFLPGIILLCAIELSAFFRRYRGAGYRRAAGFAILASLPWILLWPGALYLRSPALFEDWFWLNNVGRFLGFSVAQLGAAHDRFFWVATLPWFAAPALPLAASTCLLARQQIAGDARLLIPLLLSTTMLAVLGIAASARNNYALPMLPPLALLAIPAAAALPCRVEKVLDYALRILVAALACIIWLLWIK